jgi:hypothetical protein
MAFVQPSITARIWASSSALVRPVVIYAQGVDVHVLTAAAINGIEPEEVNKQQRSVAKAINFGSIYGMGPRALVRNTRKEFGIDPCTGLRGDLPGKGRPRPDSSKPR